MQRHVDDEDEEVMFDRASLLPRQNTTPKHNNKQRVLKTTCLLAAFFGLGLCMAILGPTLLDLQQRTHTYDTTKISRIFTVRSIGYLVGTVLGGILFNHFNHSCLIGVFLMLTAVGMALAPWWQQLSRLMACISLVGVSMGLLDTGGNVMCLELWGRKSAPYMQALHFSFGLGAFIAPLIAAPFLSPLPVVMATITTSLVNFTTTSTAIPPVDSARNVRSLLGVTGTKYQIDTSTESAYVTLSTIQTTNITHLSNSSRTEDVAKTVASLAKVVMNTLKKHLGDMTEIHFAYLLIATFLFVVALMFFATLCHECVTRSKLASENVDEDTATRHDSQCFHAQLLALMFVFYFLYVGAEVAYGGFITKFAVAYMGWTKIKAAMLTSVFWGTFAFGRGIAIFLSRCISPTVTLVADLALSVASLGALVLAPHLSSSMLWFGTAVLGFSMASIFPTGITWAERYVHIGSKSAAVFISGSALGEMIIPAFIGFLFETKNPMWLMYVLLAGAALSVIVFIIMHLLATNRGERYHIVPNNPPQDVVEMESLLVSDSDLSDSSQLTRPPNNTVKKHVTFSLPNVRPSPMKRQMGIKND